MATKKTFEPRIAPAMPGDPEGYEAVEKNGAGVCAGCAFEKRIGRRSCPRLPTMDSLACLSDIRNCGFDVVWRRKKTEIFGNEEN